MEEFVCKGKFFSLGNKITLLLAAYKKIILSKQIALLRKVAEQAKPMIELDLKLII